MSGNPSTSTAGTSVPLKRTKSTEKKGKAAKKSEAEPQPSSSMISRMMTATNPEDKPLTFEQRTTLGVRSLLNDMNIKGDPSSIDMLENLTLSICTNLLKDAQTVAHHADRTDVQPDDINFASRKYTIRQPPRMERMEFSKATNLQELPKIRDVGLHLPVDRYCITQPTFQTAIAFKMQEVNLQPSQDPSSAKDKEILGTDQIASLLRSDDDAYD